MDIILGTFSKSLASIGGFAVGGKGWTCCATAAGRISYRFAVAVQHRIGAHGAAKIARHPELREKL